MRNLLSFHKKLKWHPGANTVMYYPFENDQLDHVGSSSISNTGTKQTLGYYFNIPSGTAGTINNPPTNCRFVSFWIKWKGANGSYSQSPSTYIGKILYNFANANSSYIKKFEWDGSGTSATSNTVNTTTDVWYHMAMGCDGSKVYAYFNGVKVWEESHSGGTESIRFGYGIQMDISQYIGESVCWTAQEVLDYYNQTKADYETSYHYNINFAGLSSLPNDRTAIKGGTLNGSGLVGESVIYKSINLSSANTLTYTVTGNRSSTSRAGGDILGITNYSGTNNRDVWNSYTLYANFNSNYTYNSDGSYLAYITGSPTKTKLNSTSGGTTPVGGDYTYTYSINFTTGEFTGTQYDSSSGATKTITYTLSSNQISEIKAMGYIFLGISIPNSISNRCYTISIDIE